jgi:hypothetical protein
LQAWSDAVGVGIGLATTQAHESERETEKVERRESGAVTAPEHEVVPGVTGDRLLGVQEGSVNAAVGRLVAAGSAEERRVRQGEKLRVARALLQREGPDGNPTAGGDLSLLEQLSKMNQQQKVDKLRDVVKGGSTNDIALVWGSIGNGGDAYAVAKANPDLFKTSIDKCGMLIADMDAFKGIEAKFKDVVGATKALKAGMAARELLKAAEAGAREAAEVALKNLSKGTAASAAAVEKAIAELGPPKASRISNKSFKELAEIVGHDTQTGEKLLALEKLGPEGAAKAAADAVEGMKNLKNMDPAKANEVVMHSLDNLGYVGTIKQGGGWKEITKIVGEQSGAAGKMEAWRKSILEELQKFLEAEEKEAASKAVRTGTEKATSDLDVQAVGGAAALNAEKSEMWLAKRLGIERGQPKNVLDATIFVDPTRAHLYDVIKELTEADRAAIGASQAGLEKRLIFGSRLAEAQAKSDGKLAKQIIEEAAAQGVSDLKAFKPLTEAEQSALAKEIDGMVTELKQTHAGRKAALTKQIGEKQAIIGASHPEAYLGGGVRIQVTTRPGDAEKFEKAGVKMLGPETAAQRLIAVLSEGKFYDEAIASLRKPAADTIEVAGALKDLGKHGARACEVAGRAGEGGEALIEIGAQMELLSKAAKRPDFVKSLGDAAKMDKMIEHATGLLEQARGEVAKAVEELSKTAKISEISAEELDKLLDELQPQVRSSSTGGQPDAPRVARGLPPDRPRGRGTGREGRRQETDAGSRLAGRRRLLEPAGAAAGRRCRAGNAAHADARPTRRRELAAAAARGKRHPCGAGRRRLDAGYSGRRRLLAAGRFRQARA